MLTMQGIFYIGLSSKLCTDNAGEIAMCVPAVACCIGWVGAYKAEQGEFDDLDLPIF